MSSASPGESAETVEVHRILDASANRAREGLRVIEDYARFALDDVYLTRELKQLRHELAESLAAFGRRSLLASRDTLRDVGTAVTTAAERDRAGMLAVVTAAFKRTQEALRSLEEYSKSAERPTFPGGATGGLSASVRRLASTGRRAARGTPTPSSATGESSEQPRVISDLPSSFEGLRYRLYTLERAVLLVTESRDRLKDARLYVLVSSGGCRRGVEETVAAALAGGARIIQLREKQLPDRDLLELARTLRRRVHEGGGLFIMNDRPDLAVLSDADGVHVGQDELSVKDARRIVGPDQLVGVSTHNLDQVRQAVLDGADYLGVGPTFPSTTKAFDELAGLDFVRAAAAETTLPAFALGGITPENVSEVVAAGAQRVAVSAAVCAAADPKAACRRLLEGLPAS